MSTSSLLSGLQDTLGPELLEKIQNCSILLIGAGGIGCELLKNLALSGFRHVHVVDLDTIDVSNLNRQLLFRSQHVGMPKCTVAAEAAADMTEDPSQLQYTAQLGNVCDNTQFNVGFVQGFNLVLNALDNVIARRRVNRLCLAAGTPLIEAGTTGYLGQVKVISKGAACYECQTQERQKTYPICTIRSTPSMPVHTIVWAKELYKLLFGDKVEESMLHEDEQGDASGQSTYMKSVLVYRSLYEKAKEKKGEKVKDDIVDVAHRFITHLFSTEIQKQLDMDRYKTARKKPVALSAEVVRSGMEANAPTRLETYSQMAVWSNEQCVAEIVACLEDAMADPTVVLGEFDKDDSLCMRFVTAASNLRSMVFSIEPIQSVYSAKGIAGNIIPAIATTNAIVAGLQILQALEVLRVQMEEKGEEEVRERTSYINCLRNKTRNGLLLTASRTEDPNPDCFVCKNAIIPLTLTTTVWKFEDFLERIVKKELGFEVPTLEVGDGDCIWEEGDDADDTFQTNLPKMLPNLPCGGIKDGVVITIEDFSQDLTVSVRVNHVDKWEVKEGEDEDIYKYDIGKIPEAKTKGAKRKASSEKEENYADDDVAFVPIKRAKLSDEVVIAIDD